MDKNEVKQIINDSSLVSVTFSEIEKTAITEIHKVNARKILTNENIMIQIERFKNKQVFHENVTLVEFAKKVDTFIDDYRQILLKTSDKQIHFFKCGNKFKVREEEKKNVSTTLNRKKQYILNEGDEIPFLIELGVMSKNNLVKSNMQHKYRQINRYLEFVRDIVDELPKDRQIQIVYFGCGKSYLTFALYHYLHNILKLNVAIHGLDLKKDVIEDCSKLAKKLKFDNLSFSLGDIANYDRDTSIDMVITLHACDVATDYALFQAIKWNSRIIFSVPCCQHELNKTIQNDEFAFAFKYGIIKEKMASLITDALRAELLEKVGYKTQILEFIDTEHTPKNLLIRAIRTNRQNKDLGAIEEFCKNNNVNPTLLKLIKKEFYHE